MNYLVSGLLFYHWWAREPCWHGGPLQLWAGAGIPASAVPPAIHHLQKGWQVPNLAAVDPTWIFFHFCSKRMRDKLCNVEIWSEGRVYWKVFVWQDERNRYCIQPSLVTIISLSGIYLPFFAFLIYFKIATFSLTTAFLGYYAIILYAIMGLIVMVVQAKLVVRKHKEKEHSNNVWEVLSNMAKIDGWYNPALRGFRTVFLHGWLYHLFLNLIFLPFSDDNQIFQTVIFSFWLVTNSTLIIIWALMVNTISFTSDTIHLTQNRTFFNSITGSIIISGLGSFILFCLQIKFPSDTSVGFDITFKKRSTENWDQQQHREMIELNFGSSIWQWVWGQYLTYFGILAIVQ